MRTDCDINLFASPSAPRLSQFLVSMPTWLPIRGDYPPRPHQTRRRPRLVPQPPMSVDFTPSLYGRLQRARNGLHRHQIFEAEVIRRSRKRHSLLVTRVLLVDPEADCFRNAWLHVPKAIQNLQPASRTGLLLLTVSLLYNPSRLAVLSGSPHAQDEMSTVYPFISNMFEYGPCYIQPTVVCQHYLPETSVTLGHCMRVHMGEMNRLPQHELLSTARPRVSSRAL